MADKTGGPAFPVAESDGTLAWEGMTLRDYFAAKAMQGFCMSADPKLVAELLPDIARCAYEQADAMLAARGDA